MSKSLNWTNHINWRTVATGTLSLYTKIAFAQFFSLPSRSISGDNREASWSSTGSGPVPMRMAMPFGWQILASRWSRREEVFFWCLNGVNHAIGVDPSALDP